MLQWHYSVTRYPAPIVRLNSLMKTHVNSLLFCSYYVTFRPQHILFDGNAATVNIFFFFFLFQSLKLRYICWSPESTAEQTYTNWDLGPHKKDYWHDAILKHWMLNGVFIVVLFINLVDSQLKAFHTSWQCLHSIYYKKRKQKVAQF